MKFIHNSVFFVAYFIVSVSTFSWQNCGSKIYPVKVTSLDIYSNTTKVLYITSRVKVATNIDAPVQAKLNIYKKFFWGWTQIPCVDQVGSCLYEDLCAFSPYQHKQCPEEFIKKQLPCKCPISQGQYIAKRFPIDLGLLPHWIESGRYKIKISIKTNEKELMCLLLNMKL